MGAIRGTRGITISTTPGAEAIRRGATRRGGSGSAGRGLMGSCGVATARGAVLGPRPTAGPMAVAGGPGLAPTDAAAAWGVGEVGAGARHCVGRGAIGVRGATAAANAVIGVGARRSRVLGARCRGAKARGVVDLAPPFARRSRAAAAGLDFQAHAAPSTCIGTASQAG